MTAAAAATTAAGLAAAAAALAPPPTESPSRHPGGAPGAAEAQTREPQHPGAAASVRALRELDLGDCLCVAKYNPGLLRCVERGDQFRGNDPVYVLLVLLEGSKIGSKGSKGVTSPLSLRTPPTSRQLLETKSLLGL